MEFRPLGRTGERIPVIGMGTYALGNSTGERRVEEIKALQRGIELGMKLIDTAEVYGNGRSEVLVGQAIADYRDDVFIATKVSPEHFSYDEVIRACDASIQRLGVKFVDLYQLHWPSHRIPIRETMKAMEELVATGRTRYLGVSNFSVEQMVQAQESLPRSELASNQVRYSITSRSIEADILPFCQKEKVTVIAYSPLDTGSIPIAEIPKDLLEKYGMTPAQLMLNWVVHPEGVVAIPKAAQVSHVEENANATDIAISEADYRALSRKLR